jgi:hypothetical protein
MSSYDYIKIPVIELIKKENLSIIKSIEKEHGVPILKKNIDHSGSAELIYPEEAIEEYSQRLQETFDDKVKEELRNDWSDFLRLKEYALQTYDMFLVKHLMPKVNDQLTYQRFFEIRTICPDEGLKDGRIVSSIHEIDNDKPLIQAGLLEKIKERSFRDLFLPKCQKEGCPNEGNYLFILNTINHTLLDGYFSDKDLIKHKTKKELFDDKYKDSPVLCISSRLKSGGRFMFKFVDYIMQNRDDITDISGATIVVRQNKDLDEVNKFLLSKLQLDTNKPNRYYNLKEKVDLKFPDIKYNYIQAVPKFVDTRIETILTDFENFKNSRLEDSTLNHIIYEQIKSKKREENWNPFDRVIYLYFEPVFIIDEFKKP